MMGSYFVIEGPDGIGKTTLTTNINNELDNSILTKHPGATPLGQLLRKLVKNPDQFTELIGETVQIDKLSAQVLMMVDQISFIESILKPKLQNDNIIIADRINYISAIAYGLAEGLTPNDLNSLISLCASPIPDRIFIMRMPWEDFINRKQKRSSNIPDRFEDKGLEYLKNVYEIYMNITSIDPEITILINKFAPIERIEYIDATLDKQSLTDQTINKIIAIHESK